VGGCGFLGRYIVEMLLERGEKNVRVFDIRKGFDDPRVQYFIGDIQSEDDLSIALKDVTVLFNTVSPPHGGKYAVYYGVNVEGTRKLLDVAGKMGVKKFVHTSSSSVVFEGKDLRGADEQTPYAKNHIDPYSYTKELAEKDVLDYNGKSGVLTVALRPSGIFGPRDSQFWPALITVAKQGKWKYQIGAGDNLVDFTYVENVAHAHLLAADKMTEGDKIAGQVFIITNDEPFKLWDMTKYVYKGMGFGEPYITVPATLMWYLAMFIDLIVWLLSPIVTLHPNFTWFRVCNAVCHRYFRIEKAKKVLGYTPKVPLQEGMERTLKYYKDLEKSKKR